MDALEAVLRARELLRDVTPLRRDCGQICGAACCGCDEDGQGGMLLLAGEERLYDPLPPSFCITRDDTVLPGPQKAFIGRVRSGEHFTVQGAKHEIYRSDDSVLFPWWHGVLAFLKAQ